MEKRYDSHSQEVYNLYYYQTGSAWIEKTDKPCYKMDDIIRDDQGEPAPLLSLTDDEVFFGMSNDEQVIHLRPVGGFVDGNTGYIFYNKLKLKKSDKVDSEWREIVGTGIATVRPGKSAVRQQPGLFWEEPTLMWLGHESGWGIGAFLDKDGYVYSYHCLKGNYNTEKFTLSRVKLEDVLKADHYQYFINSEWTDSLNLQPDETENLCDRNTNISIAFDANQDNYFVLGDFDETGRALQPFIGEKCCKTVSCQTDIAAGNCSEYGIERIPIGNALLLPQFQRQPSDPLHIFYGYYGHYYLSKINWDK